MTRQGGEPQGLCIRRGEAFTDFDHAVWWDVIYELDGKPLHPFVAGFSLRRQALTALDVLLHGTEADWGASREVISASPQMPAITAVLNQILDTRPDRPGDHRTAIPDATAITFSHFHAEHARANARTRRP